MPAKAEFLSLRQRQALTLMLSGAVTASELQVHMGWASVKSASGMFSILNGLGFAKVCAENRRSRTWMITPDGRKALDGVEPERVELPPSIVIPRVPGRRQLPKMTVEERASAIARATRLAAGGDVALTDALRAEGVI